MAMRDRQGYKAARLVLALIEAGQGGAFAGRFAPF